MVDKHEIFHELMKEVTHDGKCCSFVLIFIRIYRIILRHGGLLSASVNSPS